MSAYHSIPKEELDTMPKALRLLADQIQSPDNVPAMCLRDAACMIESLASALERAEGEKNAIR